MCSIEEAWGDFRPQSNLAQGGVPAGLVQQQVSMDNQRRPDIPGDKYTQTNDRRQWAQPADELSYPQFNRDLMAKPAPEANGLSRGVHSKYSREKRFDARTSPTQGGFSGLQTDVDPNYYAREASTAPAYLDLYEKPFYELGGIATPLASNMVEEKFVPVNSVGKPMAPEINTFTPEIITNTRILAEASVPAPDNKSGSASTLNTDAIRNLQFQLKTLMAKIEALEKKVTVVEHDKSHDVVLFIVIAIFVLFVLDNIFRKNRVV